MDERVIIISEDDKSHALVTFSICNDYKPYFQKNLWDYLPHDPKGTTCYIENIISDSWTGKLRRNLQHAITKKYPQIEWAVWHRPGDLEDRVVIRRIHEASLRN